MRQRPGVGRGPLGTASEPSARGQTVSHMLGEIVWLLTQSPTHRQFHLADLEWLVMPAILHEQYYVFRDGDKPVGLALWARVSSEAEAKIERGIAEPDGRLAPEDWTSGDSLWLIDLVAPFANASNRHIEVMMADLISGPLEGKTFKLHRTDRNTGKRTVVTIRADAGSELKTAIEKVVGASGEGAGQED